jgi:hypothetical protein
MAVVTKNFLVGDYFSRRDQPSDAELVSHGEKLAASIERALHHACDRRDEADVLKLRSACVEAFLTGALSRAPDRLMQLACYLAATGDLRAAGRALLVDAKRTKFDDELDAVGAKEIKRYALWRAALIDKKLKWFVPIAEIGLRLRESEVDPPMNNEELLDRIKGDPRYRRIPEQYRPGRSAMLAEFKELGLHVDAWREIKGITRRRRKTKSSASAKNKSSRKKSVRQARSRK